MGRKDDALAQAKILEGRGYKVTLHEVYLERIDTAVDDWDFADCPDEPLITVEKGNRSVVSYSQGERRVTLKEWTEIESSIEVGSWKNVELPEAVKLLLQHFGNATEFKFAGHTYEFSVENNGWFEEYFFEDKQQHGDTTDAYYDPPMPIDVADVFEEHFAED